MGNVASFNCVNLYCKSLFICARCANAANPCESRLNMLDCKSVMYSFSFRCSLVFPVWCPEYDTHDIYCNKWKNLCNVAKRTATTLSIQTQIYQRGVRFFILLRSINEPRVRIISVTPHYETCIVFMDCLNYNTKIWIKIWRGKSCLRYINIYVCIYLSYVERPTYLTTVLSLVTYSSNDKSGHTS